MKIIKLNNRYKLGKEGFAYGLRFPSSYNKKAMAIERKLHEIYGSGWTGSKWFNSRNSEWGYFLNAKSREYYIGVREESMLTMILLGLENV